MKGNFDKLREIAITSHKNIDFHATCALVNKLTSLIHNLEYSEHNFAYYEFLQILSSNQKMFLPLLALNNMNNIRSIRDMHVCNDSYNTSSGLKISLEEIMHKYNSILDNVGVVSFYVDRKHSQVINDVIYNSALFYFDAIQETEYFELNITEISNVIVLLSLIRLGAINKGCPEIAYAKYGSFAQKIDYLGDPQLARDMAEEIMKSSEIDGIKYCGAITKFELSVKQKRLFEAMVLANFAIQSIQGLSSIKKHFYNSFFLSLMNIYRDINQTKYAKIIFDDIVKKLDTNNYEKNRSYHSYLCCLLLDKDEQVYSKTREYLSLNLELILNDGQPAAAPWYSLLSNIFKIYPEHNNDLSYFYEIFKRMLPNDILKLTDLSIGNTENIIQSLEFKINSIYKSRRVNDIGMQLKSAWPIIHNSVTQGLHDLNFNALSLAILAKSTPIEPESENFVENKRVLNPDYQLAHNNFSSSYLYQLASFVRKHKNLLMLDEHDDEVYALFASGKERRIIRNLGKLKEITAWSRNHLPKISFDEFRTIGKYREDFHSYWHEETNQILNTLPLLNIDIECSCEEIYVLPTNQLLVLPTNLIKKVTKN